MTRLKDEIRQDAYKSGVRAEFWASVFLRLKGYQILHRRYRAPVGEIDIIARRGRRMAFVEVKMRKTQAEMAIALRPQQQQRIMRAAEYFLQSRPDAMGLRPAFDVVQITPGGLPRHLRDVFDHR